MNSSWTSKCFQHCKITCGSVLRTKIRNHHSHLSSFALKTHTCGELTREQTDYDVTLCGWLEFVRKGYFITLRDSHGSTQVILPDESSRDFVSRISFESVIQVTGKVKMRQPGQHNPSMKTGDIEVVASDIKLLNNCKANLPIQLKEADKVSAAVRLSNRYLDLRSKRMQRNLRLRSDFIFRMREFLCEKHGFVDVETPLLFRRTPGGAREFVVPTHQKDAYYTLPQSPQQFKQLLMVGGIDRYMQIAKCFRDEGARPDRQPEFTQLDLEMSFVDREGIITMVEKLLHHSWPDFLGTLPEKFPRMTYEETMTNYGCDKPDLRYDPIANVTDIMRQCGIEHFEKVLAQDEGNGAYALVHKNVGEIFSNSQMKEIAKFGNDYPDTNINVMKIKTVGELTGTFKKHMNTESQQKLTELLELQVDDILVVGCGKTDSCLPLLAKVRTEMVNHEEAISGVSNDMKFLWVVDFPLFLPKEDGSPGLESAHHPFTAPHDADKHLMFSDPSKALSLHYDLVLNGREVGGGSIRIHEPQLQKYVIENVLHEDCSQLEHLIDALDSGCPPHGGIALGIDRLVAILCGESSITNVIAFPKNSRGYDAMSKAPADISDDDKKYYHLK